jgi:hypothetical protein
MEAFGVDRVKGGLLISVQSDRSHAVAIAEKNVFFNAFSRVNDKNDKVWRVYRAIQPPARWTRFVLLCLP